MTRYFTHYWTNPTWKTMTKLLSSNVDGKLARAGSNLFSKMKVHPGDHVFIVTIIKGELILGGRIIAEKVLEQADAEEYEKWGFDIWQTDKHVVMPLKDAGRFTPENIIPTKTVRKLEFVFGDEVKNLKFAFIDKLDRQTLRGVRELTSYSASILSDYL